MNKASECENKVAFTAFLAYTRRLWLEFCCLSRLCVPDYSGWPTFLDSKSFGSLGSFELHQGVEVENRKAGIRRTFTGI